MRNPVFRHRLVQQLEYHREQTERIHADYHRGAWQELAQILELYDATHPLSLPYRSPSAGLGECDRQQGHAECDFS